MIDENVVRQTRQIPREYEHRIFGIDDLIIGGIGAVGSILGKKKDSSSAKYTPPTNTNRDVGLTGVQQVKALKILAESNRKVIAAAQKQSTDVAATYNPQKILLIVGGIGIFGILIFALINKR